MAHEQPHQAAPDRSTKQRRQLRRFHTESAAAADAEAIPDSGSDDELLEDIEGCAPVASASAERPGLSTEPAVNIGRMSGHCDAQLQSASDPADAQALQNHSAHATRSAHGSGAASAQAPQRVAAAVPGHGWQGSRPMHHSGEIGARVELSQLPLKQRLQSREAGGQGTPSDMRIDPLPASQQPLMQRAQARLQHAPREGGRQPRRAPPRFSADDIAAAPSQMPLAQRLKRKSRSPDADAEAGEASRLKTNGCEPALRVQQSTEQERLRQPAEEPEFRQDTPRRSWDVFPGQVKTPAMARSLAAVVPDSTRSAPDSSAGPQWRRRGDALQGSSGKSPLSLQRAAGAQRHSWEELQCASAARGAAYVLATPVVAHASSAAAGGVASTGLVLRRPLARRRQNVLDMCTPGMLHCFPLSSLHTTVAEMCPWVKNCLVFCNETRRRALAQRL